MSEIYRAFDHREWDEQGLTDYCEFSDRVEYVFQSGEDQLEGEWYYIPDEMLPNDKFVIYFGSFGNYNPGDSSYTFAKVYDKEEYEEFKIDMMSWENSPEYIE